MASKTRVTRGGKKVDVWVGRVYIPGGKERTKRFDRQKQAEQWEQSQRKCQTDSRVTLAEWLDNGGAEAVLANLGEATRRTYGGLRRPGTRRYGGHLERIVKELGRRRLSDITAANIEMARDTWIRDGLSPSTVNGTLNCLARVFRQAVKSGDLQASPMASVERPRASAPVATPTLELDDVERLANECDKIGHKYNDYPWGDYVRLAAFLGLRAGELTALTVGDVDLARGVVTVRQANSAGTIQTTKSKRVRQVPITGHLVPLLRKWTTGRPKEAPLLIGPLGGHFNHSNFRDAVDWVRLVDRLGWPGFRFHDLRATAIVLWIKAGIPLATVREMAGHASLTTTDRYARMARNDLSAAAAAMESYFSSYSKGEIG